MQFSNISGILSAPGVPGQESYTFWPAARTSHTYSNQRYTIAATPVASGTALLSSGHRLLNGIVLFRLPLSDAFCEMFHCALPQALGLCSSDFEVIFILSSSQNTLSTVSICLGIHLLLKAAPSLVSIISLFLRSLPLESFTQNPAPHTLPFLLPLGCPFLSFFTCIVQSVVLHHGFPCPSHSACLSIFFWGGGSELLSAPSLEKHCSL